MDYLLAVTSSGSRRKAAFFLSFGFSIDCWQEFAEALKLHGRTHEVANTVETPHGPWSMVHGPWSMVHGPRYHVDGTIESPDGRNPRVRTVWQVDAGSDYPRFITAFQRRR